MADPSYTVLLTSNFSANVKTLVVSRAWVRAGLLFTGFSLILLGFLVADYINLLKNYNEQENLIVENSILKQNFKVVEGKVSSLENSLQRIQGFSEKLKNITNKGKTKPEVIAKPSRRPSSVVSAGVGGALAGRVDNWFERLGLGEKAPLDPSKEVLSDYTTQDMNNLSLRIDGVTRVSKLEESSIMTLWESLSEKRNLLDSTPNMRPVKGGWQTSLFGYRFDPFTKKRVMHSGLDIAAAPGTPVYAPANGVVSYVGYESGYGNLVTIDHGYGVKTRYAHNSKTFVKYRQRVRRGDKIAAVGNTGRSSGAHLHYEVRVNGVPVNPSNYILED